MSLNYLLRLQAVAGAISMPAGIGAFALSGKTVNTSWARRMLAAQRAYSLTSNAASLTYSGTFPLSVSSSGRYLQKANGSPFLVNNCAASWGLIQSVTLSAAQTIIDRIAALGFNSLTISLISNDVNMPGSPPNWQGVAPFTTAGNFSTANSSYFTHADAVIAYAVSKGLHVFLVISYLGYVGVGGVQGWADEMNADTDAHCAAFGTYAATRYGSNPNISVLWGGDQLPGTGVGDSVILSRFTSMVDAYLAVSSTQLVTSHLAGDYGGGRGTDDPVAGGMFTRDFTSLSSRISSGKLIDGIYSYNPSIQTYTRFRAQWALTAAPLLSIDTAAESGTQPQGTAREVREKAHKNMCEGACGHSYTHGEQWWYFTDWTSGSQGQSEAGYWYSAWNSIAWHTMTPDSSSSYLTSGRGTYGNAAYVTARMSPTGGAMYLPHAAALSPVVAMSQFASYGGTIPARKIDPTSGASTALSGSPFTTSGTQTISQAALGNNSAGDSDWLVVLG